MKPTIIYDASLKKWLKFKKEIQVIETYKLDKVISKLKIVEEMVKKGFFAVGFISYNAAPAFDKAIETLSDKEFPLIYFAIYEPPNIFEFPTMGLKNYSLIPKKNIHKKKYFKKIDRIKEEIKAGNIYQVNYTYKIDRKIDKGFNAFDFFLNKMQNHKGEYACYMETKKSIILSFSPELFFSLSKKKIVSKPMKGTAKRGKTIDEDEKQKRALFNSEKERSENVMICDMIRNDLSKIGVNVRVEKLFEIEKYPTILQMTSTVSAETKKSVTDILRALFPCASVTGAPKVKATSLIKRLEQKPRNLYTGAIGFIAPKNRAQFNVAIRTLIIDKEEKVAEYGVGSGIVWDSKKESEYNECIEKTKVLQKKKNFSLIESFLWTKKNGLFLFEEHIKRAKRSASYFDYKWIGKEYIKKRVLKSTKNLPLEQYKIRVLLNSKGKIRVYKEPLKKKVRKIELFHRPIDSKNIFLYHKTTNRELYKKYNNFLFYNELNEITESSTSNVVFKIGKKFYTPFAKSGLLEGSFRNFLIKKRVIKEKKILLDDIKKADKIYLINSVRKWQKVEIV